MTPIAWAQLRFRFNKCLPELKSRVQKVPTLEPAYQSEIAIFGVLSAKPLDMLASGKPILIFLTPDPHYKARTIKAPCGPARVYVRVYVRVCVCD